MTFSGALFKTVGNLLSPGGARGRLTILTYHRVLAHHDPLLPDEQTDTRSFLSHMQAVKEAFNVLPLPDAIEMLYQGRLPERALSITFDDGYQNNYAEAFPILQHLGLTATFFVCSAYLGQGLMFNDILIEALRQSQTRTFDLSWLGLGERTIDSEAVRLRLSEDIIHAVKYMPADLREQACERVWDMARAGQKPHLMMTPEQVKELTDKGMTIGGHTHTHPILNRVTLADAKADIQINRQALSDIIGQPPQIFAYPNGKPGDDFNQQHVDLVKALGYSAAVTTAWGVASPSLDRFQLPRFAPWNESGHKLVMHLLKNSLNRTPPRVA